MSVLQWQGFLGVQDPDLATGLRAFERVQTGGQEFVITSTAHSGGLISYRLSDSAPPVEIDRAYAPDDGRGGLGGVLSPLTLNGQLYVVTGADATGRLSAYSVSNTGGLGARQVLDGPEALAGGAVYLAQGSDDLLWLAGADATGGYIRSYQPDGQGGYTPTALLRDGEGIYLTDPIALKTVSLQGTEYVITLSGGVAGVSVFAVNPTTAALTATSALGVQDGLGILSAPQTFDVITAHGGTYLVVASATEDGGALSVLELDPNGTLHAVDHILDTRETRFGAVQDLSIVQSEGWTYVLAAGGDGGISLFTLMPGGALVHLDTIVHQTGQGLSGLHAMTAWIQGDGIQVLVGSEDVADLGQLRFDLSEQGQAIEGTGANQTLTGADQNDLIAGGTGNEWLRGQGGDDILMDGAGRDTLEGGTGVDLYVPVMDGARDRITGFSPGVDLLDLSHWWMLYDPSQLQIESTSWGARITWRGEELDLFSTAGTPLSRAQVEAAVVQAADRPPLVLGDTSDLPDPGPVPPPPPPPGPVDQMIQGGPGPDTLTGGAGNDTLRGDGGHNLLRGNAGADELRGLGGNDTAEGGLGRDRAFLGGGNDLYIDDAEDGLEGRDLVYVGDGDDTIRGGGGADIFHGMNGADLLEGGSGNDTIYAGTGFDVVWGGAGQDELWAGEGFDTVYGEAGDDVIYGLPGFDLLDGGAGDDTLWGGDGRDTIVGGLGQDLGYLGAGPDTFLDAAEGGIAGRDEMFMGAGNDSAYGQGGDDILHGMDGDDLLEGGAGNDTLFGGANADRLIGGDGHDVIWGGLGRDFAQMGAGDDRFEDSDQGGDLGRDTVFAGAGRDTVNGNAGNDEFHGQDGDDLLRGGAGADTLFGGANADRLFGGDGHDVIWGGLGTDYAEMGAGDDRFEDTDQGGALGRDTVFAGAGHDTVNGNAGDDLFHGQAGNDRLGGGAGADTLTGGNGADTLLGQDGHDQLEGGLGADHLEGGRGFDTLMGGAGADMFVFSGLTGEDLIIDFAPGQDQLILDQAGITGPEGLVFTDQRTGLHLGWEGGGVLLQGVFGSAFDEADLFLI